MSGLQIDIADKRFDEQHPVLEHLHLDVSPGEFLAIVGPSGAGKTTLLSLIAGLDQAFSGTLNWNRQPLHAAGTSPLKLGILFQEPRLMPWLSVLDNVRLVLKQASDARDRARQLLTRVGLGDWLDAWPGQLSGGMQRRVALARAFAVQPQLLLMDEPFVSLDMPTGNQLRSQTLELWQRERPLVIYVTHDLREALAMADRVVFLSTRPAQVLLDVRVELSRPRRLEGPQVAALQTQLLSAHPDLLAGRLGGNSPRTGEDA